jgi:hypothetical protein
MDYRSIQNTAAIAGIVFVVLLLVGIFMRDTPDSGASAQEWASYFSDGGNRTQVLISAYLMVLSSLAFIVFLWALMPEFGEPGGLAGVLLRIALASGMAFAMLLMVGAIALASVAGSVSFGDAPVPDGDFARQFEQLGFGLILLGGGLAAALSIATLSWAAMIEAAWPRWLVIIGFIAAIALLFSVVLIPLIALPIWVLVVAIELLAQHPAPAEALPPSAAAAR